MKRITFLIILAMFVVSSFAQTGELSPTAGQLLNNHKTNLSPWNVQIAIPIPASLAAGTYGIESDGTTFYVSKFNSAQFYHFSVTGALLDSFSISGVTNIRDLAYDGTYFYGGAFSNTIYKMNFTTHTLVSSIALPAGFAVRHISYDPTANSGAGGLWCGPWNGQGPRLYSLTGTFLDSIPAANLGTASCAGSAFDNVSPGGPYLWLYSQTTNMQDVIQVKISTKQLTGLTHDMKADLAALTGSAGGMFLTTNLITGTTTLGGLSQGNEIWGVDLASTVAPAKGAKVTSITNSNYVQNNVAQTISGIITNIGLTAITSMNLNYTINGGTTYTQNVTGVNVASFATYSYAHTTTWTPTATGPYVLKVWASNINGDATFTTDTMTKTITVLSSIPVKRVFCEEATGTWCGWCVRGIVNMDAMGAAHPTDWVGIGVHNADPMAVTAWNAGVTSFPGFTGFPTIIVDRTILTDPSSAATAYTTQKAVVSPVDVSLGNVSYNEATRVISFNINAKPAMSGTVNWNIAGAIYEMGVNWMKDPSPAADSANYDQHNYYAGGSYGAMGGFETKPSVIPATQISFDWVGRALCGGFTGTAGSIPATIVDGTTYTKNYTYTVPAYQDPYAMHVVGFVVDVTSGKVLNSIQQALSSVGITENHTISNVRMYPNPTKGIIRVEGLSNKSQITVTNILGETMLKVTNTNTIDLSNYTNGVYFITVNTGNNVVTEKIILNK